MTARALCNLGVDLVGEPDELRNLVDADPRNGLFFLRVFSQLLDVWAISLDTCVALHALGLGRECGRFAIARHRMALRAFQPHL